VTPSVAAPGDTNPSDATGYIRSLRTFRHCAGLLWTRQRPQLYKSLEGEGIGADSMGWWGHWKHL